MLDLPKRAGFKTGKDDDYDDAQQTYVEHFTSVQDLRFPQQQRFKL